jgi:hypothetical protein
VQGTAKWREEKDIFCTQRISNDLAKYMEIQYIIYIFLSSKFLLECAIAITHLRHQTNLAIPLIIYILFSITD